MKKFNLYFTLFNLAFDGVAIVLALVLAYFFRGGGESIYLWPFSYYLRLVLLFLPLWLIVLGFQGLYSLTETPRGWNAFARIFIGQFSVWAMMIVILYLWKSPQALVFPRLIIVYGSILAFIIALFGRYVLSVAQDILQKYGIDINHCLLVKKGETKDFVNELETSKGGRKVVGVVQSDYLEQIKKSYRYKKFDEVIVADPDLDEETILDILGWTEEKGLNFIFVPSLFTVHAVNVDTGILAKQTVMFFKRAPLNGWGRIIKRVVDIIIVVPLLIVLSPVLLVCALAVKLSSAGPIIYRQARIRQDGETFYVYKFRSIYHNASGYFGRDWSSNEESDPQITSVGRILRKTTLDKLLQFFVVLIGKMSLVGPRPEQPKHVKKFRKKIPEYLKRYYVNSGLTGWAQINGLRGDASISERVKYDLYYIKNLSVWFDLRIILSNILLFFKSCI